MKEASKSKKPAVKVKDIAPKKDAKGGKHVESGTVASGTVGGKPKKQHLF